MEVIVVTGATSGIGAEAIKHFAEQPGTMIIIGARGSGRMVPKGTEVFPLDLSSLESVRSFADDVKKRLGGSGYRNRHFYQMINLSKFTLPNLQL